LGNFNLIILIYQIKLIIKERPEIDLFKAIFENEEEENDDDVNQDEAEEEENEDELEHGKDDQNDNKNIINQENTTLIPSSFSGVNLNQINKYLNENETVKMDQVENENNKILFKKPMQKVEEKKEKFPEITRFSNLVKELVKKVESSSDTSSQSSFSSDEYEEVSISKKSSHKKKKKKKKHHKKTSKKKHHKTD
jgi:hypothetical protein